MATFDPSAHGLLDRDSVLREIDALIREAAARGIRSIVRVTGPPGIGKTAVLRRTADAFDGTVAFVAAEAATQNDAGAALQRLAEDRARRAGTVLAPEDVLHGLVRSRALIVIDDVQCLDEQSRRMLLGALTRSTGVALLLSDRRPQAPEWPPHETVTLSPLRRAAALELIRRMYPAAHASVAAELADAADGVPLVLTILARDAAARDITEVSDAKLSVSAVVAAHLGRSPPAAQEAARLIALTEPPVSLSVLASALDVTVDELAVTLSDLRDLISLEGGEVAFRHDTLATAVALTVSNPVQLYARLLAGYEAEPGSLAAIVRCALECGRRDRAAAAALDLARMLARAGSLGSALQYAKTAFDNAPPSAAVECTIEYAYILQLLSRDGEAASLLRAAIRAAMAARDLASASALVAAFLSAAVTLERFTELDGVCRRIEETPGCPRAIAERMVSVRRRSLAYAGYFDEFVRLDAATESRTWLDARAAAFVHAFRGDFERAMLELDEYAAALEQQHARQQTADDLFESAVGFFYHGTGVLEPLKALPVERTRHPSERGLRALASVCAGRWDEADELLAVDAEEEIDEPYAVLEVRVLLAALRGTLPDDARVLRTLRSMIRQRRVRHAASPARWLAVAKGRETPPDVDGFVRETLDVAPMPYDFSASPLALARLAGRYGADPCRAAMDRYPAFETPWHRAHRQLARGLAERSDELLRNARTTFDELNCPALAMVAGLELPVPRARDLALARRLNLRRDAPPSIVALTKRERSIAERVSAGASNQEIAAAMSISVRTVETHLTKIYAKLGVTSRGAMSALLHREVI
jgi:DNA-binding CsgD family transcriptional regulator